MYEIGFPQKVYSGLDSVEKLPEILKEKKIQKVLVMTDQGVYPQKAFQKVLSLLEAYDKTRDRQEIFRRKVSC